MVEIVLRILNIGYGNAPLEKDRTLHHKHPENYTFTSYNPSNEYGGHYVKFDDIGNRIPFDHTHDPRKRAIWFLGDSFTETLQVSWDKSYIGQLESLLGYRYNGINFGVSSYSPLLYILQLKKYLVLKTKPYMIFIQLSSNDVSDDDTYKGSAKFNNKDEPEYCDGGETNILTKVLRKLYIARALRKAQLIYQYRRKTGSQQAKAKADLQTKNYIEEAPAIDSSLRFAKSIFQINDLLDSLGIPHYFFAIPSKYSCNTGNWTVNTFSKNFISFSRASGIPVIDIDEAFRLSSYKEKLFYNIDIHCNEKGNALIAKTLYQAVIPYLNP